MLEIRYTFNIFILGIYSFLHIYEKFKLKYFVLVYIVISSVMFASEKKTYLTILPELCLSFRDLLIPFPWLQLNVMEDSILESFTNLWDYFTSDDRQPR